MEARRLLFRELDRERELLRSSLTLSVMRAITAGDADRRFVAGRGGVKVRRRKGLSYGVPRKMLCGETAGRCDAFMSS
jgi:hypothetical protein